MTDDHFMSIALKLAEKNLGNVAPNPAVGCVIVKDGTIISEGYTGIDSRVSGGGIKALKEAGIEVEQGIMQKDAEELNVGFFTTKKLHS